MYFDILSGYAQGVQMNSRNQLVGNKDANVDYLTGGLEGGPKPIKTSFYDRGIVIENAVDIRDISGVGTDRYGSQQSWPLVHITIRIAVLYPSGTS
jgi:hypothetical protein